MPWPIPPRERMLEHTSALLILGDNWKPHEWPKSIRVSHEGARLGEMEYLFWREVVVPDIAERDGRRILMCPSCGHRLLLRPESRPGFCSGCGARFHWEEAEEDGRARA